MKALAKKVINWIAPDAEKETDGRDKWPSRASFVLAAMVRCFYYAKLHRFLSCMISKKLTLSIRAALLAWETYFVIPQ